MVSPSEWGPHAWTLLHGIAERVGRHDKMLLIRDEQNAIRLTLRHFGALLPCNKCQNHYKGWLQKHAPELFVQRMGEDLRLAFQDWLFNLHESVNERNEVVSGIERDKLSEMYGSVRLREELAHLRNVYQRGIQQGVLKPEEWKAAYKHLDILLRLVGS
jgi:hypothetical protein